MIGPIAKLRDWIEFRRKAREVRAVATAHFLTRYQDTGWDERHVLTFLVDGNGRRFEEVESTKQSEAQYHAGILHYRVLWRVHGQLPSWAERVDNRPRGKLIVFPGGGGNAA